MDKLAVWEGWVIRDLIYKYAKKMTIKLLVYLFFVSLASVLFSCSGSNPDSQDTQDENKGSGKPNIILIMNDDMGYECLSCNGSVSYNTPVLDKLAKEGLRFTNCHSQPLCTPSRVKIMTGIYNSRNYIDFGYLDPGQITFGNILQDAGYKTMVAGKWQLNGVHSKEEGHMDVNRPLQFGFDEYCLWWLTQTGSRYAHPVIVENGTLLETTIDDYGPDIVSDYITGFIDRNHDQPFFVYYPMILVHSPFQPTPDSPEWASLETRSARDTGYFKDMVEYTDKIIGKIVAKLDEHNLSENTIVLFTGDNGTHPSIVTQTKEGPYPGGKGYLMDNGTHVPLVISWPAGGSRGITFTELIEFSDFMPTFADAAKAQLPPDIDGRSFFGLLANGRYKPRKSIFIHYYPRTTEVSPRNGCFARTTRYKLYSDGKFFDMYSDKWEKSPLDTESLKRDQSRHYKKLKKVLNSQSIWDFSIPHTQ
jgi:arylsulfatase A